MDFSLILLNVILYSNATSETNSLAHFHMVAQYSFLNAGDREASLGVT